MLVIGSAKVAGSAIWFRTFASELEPNINVETPQMVEVKNTLKQIRGRISQKMFAKKLGVHVNTIQRWEAGVTVPDANDLIRIANEFAINPAWILLGIEPKYLKDIEATQRPGELFERPSHPVVRLEDAPVERIKMWLDELIAENPAYRGWLDIEFPKRFPEYREWTEKKRQAQLLENSEPLTENSA